MDRTFSPLRGGIEGGAWDQGQRWRQHAAARAAAGTGAAEALTKKSDGTVQAAILLPMACWMTCAVVVENTLWLGAERGQISSQSIEGLPCLIGVPLGR